MRLVIWFWDPSTEDDNFFLGGANVGRQPIRRGLFPNYFGLSLFLF